MPRRIDRTAPLLALLSLHIALVRVSSGPENTPRAAGEKASRDALARFDKNWKDYTNAPHYGDPRWKLKVETLVRLARAGPAALPVLEAAGKDARVPTIASQGIER